MNTPLHPCPTCQRHIRISSTSCPFCAGALPSAFGETVVRRIRTPGLSRTALLALGVMSSAAATACENDNDKPAKTADAAIQSSSDAGGTQQPERDAAPPEAAPNSGMQPVYGAPPPPRMDDDAGTKDAAPPPNASDAPVYGAPPPRLDAGADTKDAGPTVAPVYGAPPPR